jgi:hypothetical protein
MVAEAEIFKPEFAKFAKDFTLSRDRGCHFYIKGRNPVREMKKYVPVIKLIDVLDLSLAHKPHYSLLIRRVNK